MPHNDRLKGPLSDQCLTKPEAPQVTVVIPTYNCAPYLHRTIESALGQTYPNIECIVVNDGSTDESAEIALTYAPRVKLINQKNGGASSARNTGIEHASGDFIAFLDADDYWHPTKIDKQIRLLLKHPRVVLVTTDLAYHSNGEPPSASVMALAEAQCATDQFEVHDDFLALFRDPYLCTTAVLVRTSRAREIGGFDVSLPIAEDLDFFFRACARHTYGRVKQPLTIYNQRPGTLSHTQPGFRLNLEVLERLERSYPEFANAHRHEFNSKRLSIYTTWVAKCIMRGRGQQARALLHESRRFGTLQGFWWLWIKSILAGPIAMARRLGQPSRSTG